MFASVKFHMIIRSFMQFLEGLIHLNTNKFLLVMLFKFTLMFTALVAAKQQTVNTHLWQQTWWRLGIWV